MRVPFDPEDPPKEPPRGVDPLLWRISRLLWEEHQIRRADMCQARSCRALSLRWPCARYRLASVGLLAAAGSRAPWATLNRSGHFR